MWQCMWKTSSLILVQQKQKCLQVASRPWFSRLDVAFHSMSGSIPQMSVASNVIPKLSVSKQEGSVTRTLGQEDGSNMKEGRKWGSGDAQGWQDCCGNQEGVNPALGHHGSNPCGEQGCVLPAISVNQPMSGHPSVKCKGLVSCLTSQQGGHIEFDLRSGLWGRLASQLRG